MCCEKECRPLRLINAIITFLVCAFDSGLDWYAFSQFVKYKGTQSDPGHEVDRKLTVVLGILCGVATIIFAIEIANAVRSWKMYTSSEDDISDGESSLDRWQDVTAFMQVVLQDCPMSVIIAVQYFKGSCALFDRLFVNRFTGSLIVLSFLIGTGWKLLMSLFNCMCSCGRGEKGCGWKCCCCICRIVRSILAAMLVGFSIYLLFLFSDRNAPGKRDDCLDPDGRFREASKTIFDYYT